MSRFFKIAAAAPHLSSCIPTPAADDGLAVHPSLRGRGLGRALAQHCVERARGIGAPVLGIHSAAFMVAACHLYRHMGFDRCPEHDLRASAILGVAPGEDDVSVIAFRLKLAGR